MIALNGISFWLGIALVSITTPVIVAFLAGITRLARYLYHPLQQEGVLRSRIGAISAADLAIDITGQQGAVNRSRIGALRYVFRLAVALFGLGLILVGYNLVEARFDFLGGFSLVIGIQTFCWVIGIRLEILGNVTNDVFDRQGEAEASRHASSPVQQ